LGAVALSDEVAREVPGGSLAGQLSIFHEIVEHELRQPEHVLDWSAGMLSRLSLCPTDVLVRVGRFASRERAASLKRGRDLQVKAWDVLLLTARGEYRRRVTAT
jgi:hypothetical protein